MAERTVYIIDLDDRVKNKLRGVQGEAKKTDSIFSSLGGKLAGLFAGISVGTAIASIVQATARFQSLSNSIKFASDSAFQGELSMQWLSNFSGKWGLDLESAAEGFRTFQGAMMKTKFSSNEVRTMFGQVSMGIVAMGLSAEDAKGVFLALGQMQSKGKISAEELRGQLGERLPGAMAIMARATGHTVAELDGLMRDGALLSEDVLPKFAAEMERTFGSGAALNADSLSSNINRVTNSWLELKVAIGESNEGLMADALKGTSSLLDKIANQFRDINQLASKGSSNRVEKILGGYEDDAKFRIKNLRKNKQTKEGVEEVMNYFVDDHTKAMSAKLAKLKEEAAKMEKQIINPRSAGTDILGLGAKFGLNKEMYVTKEHAYKNNPEYAELMDQISAKERVMQGLRGIADKQISSAYMPKNALPEGKTKKKSAGGITLNESKNGATNITFNIDTFQKNEFSSEVDKIGSSVKTAVEMLKLGLVTVVNDSQIAAGR